MHDRRLESSLSSQGWIYGPFLVFALRQDDETNSPIDVLAVRRDGEGGIVCKEESLHGAMDFLDSHYPVEKMERAEFICRACRPRVELR